MAAPGLLGNAEATAQTHVKIGIVSPTFGHAPFYVARDKGFYKKAVWARDGRPSVKGLQLVIDLMSEDGLLKKPIKPQDVIDNSYLREIGAR